MPISKIKSSAIDPNAITGSGIADGTIDTADLAAGAVTSAKLDTNIDIAGTLDVTGTLTADSNITAGSTVTSVGGMTSSAASGNNLILATNSGTTNSDTAIFQGNAGSYYNQMFLYGSGESYFQTNGTSLTFGTVSNTPVYVKTNNINRMVVDANGYVTMPNQPAVQVSYSGGNIAGQVIPLNANSSTRGGMTIDTVNNRVTVPVSGWYKIGFSHLANQASAQVWIEINGVQVQGSASQQTSGGNGTFSSQVIVSLSANDYIHWEVGGTYLIHGNSTYNTMYAHLLG